MDAIHIENLKVFANHGVFREENALGQKFVVTVRLRTDTRRSGRSDELCESINYAEVCETIEQSMTERTFKLIEAAAEYTAERLLLKYPLIKELELTVKKPHAPVKSFIDYAAVTIERGWHTAYIGIGSNMGDKRAYLDTAVNAFRENALCRGVRASEYIVTEPVGGVEQDDFLNGAIEVKTLMTAHELLDFANEIERGANRMRTVRWGPRTLDVDILLYDSEIISGERLTVPHKELHRRRFALEPLCELNPYAYHPCLGKTVSRLLEEL